jgi:hypothetical protein
MPLFFLKTNFLASARSFAFAGISCRLSYFLDFQD